MLPLLGALMPCLRLSSLTPVSPGRDKHGPVVTGRRDKPFVILSAVCCMLYAVCCDCFGLKLSLNQKTCQLIHLLLTFYFAQ